MKIALCAAILILCTPSVTSPQARDGVTPPRGGSGVIAGVVLVDEPGTPPARRARVTLNTLDRREPGMTVTTDDAGAFTFAGIPSGSYLIQASKTGYLTTNLGAKRSERPGTAVVLKDGERLTGLTMRLTRGGVITGTIFDQNGRPLPDVAVTVLNTPGRHLASARLDNSIVAGVASPTIAGCIAPGDSRPANTSCARRCS